MFTRILVPTDFSETSDAALEYARGLALAFGASLHVLHVIEVPRTTGAPGAEDMVETPAAFGGLFDQAKGALTRRVPAADRARLHASTEILVGTSVKAIIDYATDRRIDLIVMGTHGRHGIARLLVGSVAEQVIRKAPCPVMAVRGRRASWALSHETAVA
jgi:nucleotide-binding universal stress UspA family protein